MTGLQLFVGIMLVLMAVILACISLKKAIKRDAKKIIDLKNDNTPPPTMLL